MSYGSAYHRKRPFADVYTHTCCIHQVVWPHDVDSKADDNSSSTCSKETDVKEIDPRRDQVDNTVCWSKIMVAIKAFPYI